jgi:hypothetical protein
MHYGFAVKVLNAQGSLVEKSQSEYLGQALIGIDVEVQRVVVGKFDEHVHHVLNLIEVNELDDIWVIERLVQTDLEVEIFSVRLREPPQVDLFILRA